ncbi:MIP family Ig-specific serine endopeptidase [[Mycoplasma] imitans]|uniref:MIP family Ig-specific serine endopeptidase n=1 Tax=[Mycoplasma] imitans TaxID=29560 RepID=UPI00048443F0|nr:DUF31 family protein [[Mycoplasma] imitans]
MLRKSAWFKLLCGLSAVSFMAASCQKVQTPASKSAEEVFKNLTANDIAVQFNQNQDKTKILPSKINANNFFNYFVFSLNTQIDKKEFDKFNFEPKNFVPNDHVGTLAFKVDVSLTSKLDDVKNLDITVSGMMTNGTDQTMNNSNGSGTTNPGSPNDPNSTEHDPNDCPPEDNNPPSSSSSTRTLSSSGNIASVNNAGESDGGAPPPPNFPNGFPGFPSVDKAFIQKQNSYPDYVSQKYTEVSSETIYKEIYDRTFSIRPGVFTENNGTTTPIVDQGTGWVLDYAKNPDNNKQLKLFIATNLHVIGNYGNSNTKEMDDMLSYSDPTGAKPSSFAIGKSSKTPPFTAQANNQTNQQLLSSVGNMIYYANNNQNSGDRSGSQINNTNAFSNPKLIFAAVDYLDDKALNQYKPQIDKKWNEWKQNTLNSINNSNDPNGFRYDEETKQRLIKLTQYDGKISFYTDFGILELDVDLSKADNILTSWINKSTQAVDSYVTRIKSTPNLPNYNPAKGNFFPTLDYMSKHLGLASCKPSSQYGVDNAKYVYIAGYPKNSDSAGFTFWMKNNPSERYNDQIESDNSSNFRVPASSRLANKDLFNVPSYSNFTASATSRTWSDFNNIQIYTKLWNRPFIDRYGFNYFSKFSSLYFGASGSVVYNEFGQIIGIYDSVSSRANFGDISHIGGFASLVQAANIPNPGDPKVINYAYNLIDKTGFPHQTRSYRSNLELFYPNGFTWPSSSGSGTTTSNKITAIFPQGY